MSDLPAEAGERKYAAHNVIAVFPDATRAREAIEHLERKGVDSSNIELLGAAADQAALPVTNDEQRSADGAVLGKVGRRSGSGLLIGAVGGAVVVGLLALLLNAVFDLGNDTAVVGGGILGGALFGAFGGAFYGGATGLPVSDAWSDTFEAVRSGNTCVAVHSEEAGQVDTAIDALSAKGGHTRLARFGRDGRTTEV